MKLPKIYPCTKYTVYCMCSTTGENFRFYLKTFKRYFVTNSLSEPKYKTVENFI